jgi:hypothetical protein
MQRRVSQVPSPATFFTHNTEDATNTRLLASAAATSRRSAAHAADVTHSSQQLGDNSLFNGTLGGANTSALFSASLFLGDDTLDAGGFTSTVSAMPVLSAVPSAGRTERREHLCDTLLRAVMAAGTLKPAYRAHLARVAQWNRGRREMALALQRFVASTCPASASIAAATVAGPTTGPLPQPFAATAGVTLSPGELEGLAGVFVALLDACEASDDLELACVLKTLVLAVPGLAANATLRACHLWESTLFWEHSLVLACPDLEVRAPGLAAPSLPIAGFRTTLAAMLALGVGRAVCDALLLRVAGRLALTPMQITVFHGFVEGLYCFDEGCVELAVFLVICSSCLPCRLLVKHLPRESRLVLVKSWVGGFGFSCEWDAEQTRPVVLLRSWALVTPLGVQNGDLLLSVNGTDTRQVTPETLQRMLADAPDESTFVFAT